MNSGIQCLSNTKEIAGHFLTGQFKQHINKDNPLGAGGKLAISFAELLRNLWIKNKKVISPYQFKKRMENFATQFQGYGQHDSQELINYLLDGLHEDLNQIKKKPYVETIESDGRPDAIVSQVA